MLSTKLRHPPDGIQLIETGDPNYQMDPCELKLVEMLEVEPEPEMIEGLPASDALTPADRYLELFEAVQSARILPTAKPFPTARRAWIRWIS